MRRGDDMCRRPAVGSEKSEEGERVEVLQRDDAHAWQRDGEGLDVTLQVVDRQALALQSGQLGVEELAEAQDPHRGAGLQEPLDVGDVVAVVAAQQDVGLLAGLDPLGQRLQGALNTDVDAFSSLLPDPASGTGR